MSAPATPNAGETWREEGRRAAAILDAVGSAVVVGRDAEAAAWVALGLAQAQSARRRVAVADLVGEVGPLQALVDPESDPHGISDSFLYGVSLNKIAHPADASGNLFILPSGSEAVATEEVFRSDRWRRLASGFREVGALLILVAQADTPGLDALATSVDGVVIAGDASGALADAPPPLAVIGPTRRRGARTAAPDAAPNEALAADDRPRAARAAPSGRPAWHRWAALAVLSAAIAGVLAFWVFPSRTSKTGDIPPRADTAVTRDTTRRADSARGSTAGDSAANPGALAPLAVANAADSASALLYSVMVAASNTPEGAASALDARTTASLPVVALTPILQDGAPGYHLLVGAFPSRAEADSLRVSLQRLGVLGPESGIVRRTPYALLVEERVPLANVPARVQALAKQNVPVYPLSRGDGTVALYAGAFEQPEQAAWLARALRAAGVTPTLVYRTGRSL